MLDTVSLSGAKPFVEWICSKCGNEYKTFLSDLVLGGPSASGGNPDIIYLPVCTCGTQTFLQRTWDSHQDADQPIRHVINALAQHLKSKGRSHEDAKHLHVKEDVDEKVPHFLSKEKVMKDLTGREAAKQIQAKMEARKAEQEAKEADVRAAAEKAEAERLLQIAAERRLVAAKASVNKRLGLPPGSEPPAEELEAELLKSADEFVK